MWSRIRSRAIAGRPATPCPRASVTPATRAVFPAFLRDRRSLSGCSVVDRPPRLPRSADIPPSGGSSPGNPQPAVRIFRFGINDLAAKRGRLALTIVYPASGGWHFFAILDGLAET